MRVSLFLSFFSKALELTTLLSGLSTESFFGLPVTVWTLGVLLFELVCGELPFTSDEEIIAGHLIFLLDLSRGEKMHFC